VSPKVMTLTCRHLPRRGLSTLRIWSGATRSSSVIPSAHKPIASSPDRATSPSLPPAATTIHVALTPDDNFDSKLDSSLKFAGSLALNPGFTDYYGQLQGQFAQTANGIQVGGTMKTTSPSAPSCSTVFRSSRHVGVPSRQSEQVVPGARSRPYESVRPTGSAQ